MLRMNVSPVAFLLHDEKGPKIETTSGSCQSVVLCGVWCVVYGVGVWCLKRLNVLKLRVMQFYTSILGHAVAACPNAHS